MKEKIKLVLGKVYECSFNGIVISGKLISADVKTKRCRILKDSSILETSISNLKKIKEEK